MQKQHMYAIRDKISGLIIEVFSDQIEAEDQVLYGDEEVVEVIVEVVS